MEIEKIDAIKMYYNYVSNINQIYGFNKELGGIFDTRHNETNSHFSDKEKIEILENVNKGKSLKEIAKEYDVSIPTLYRWNVDLKVFESKKKKYNKTKIKKINQMLIQNKITSIIADNNEQR